MWINYLGDLINLDKAATICSYEKSIIITFEEHDDFDHNYKIHFSSQESAESCMKLIGEEILKGTKIFKF